MLIDRPQPKVIVITLNRPDKRNAMNHALLAGLYDALNAAREDRTCRVILEEAMAAFIEKRPTRFNT